jgi:hypothetical protein
LQIIAKTPRCLVETLEAVSNNFPAHRYIDIFVSELLDLLQEIHLIAPLSDLEATIFCVLRDARDLYEATHHFRVDELLYLSRNSFIQDLEYVFIFSKFYLEFGYDQIQSLNRGAFLTDDFEPVLTALIDRCDRNEGNPKVIFESLLSTRDISLSSYGV